MATKDEGKAAITVIEYSAPDRTMLFSFYNHPQPLCVWTDGTSISPGKSNLHMDVGYGMYANIKGEAGDPRKRVGKKGQEPEPPRLYRRERLLEANMAYFCMNTMVNHRPVIKA